MKDLPISDLHRLEFYLSKAAEAEQSAEAAKDTEIRQTWLRMVRSWQMLADHVTRTGKL